MDPVWHIRISAVIIAVVSVSGLRDCGFFTFRVMDARVFHVLWQNWWSE